MIDLLLTLWLIFGGLYALNVSLCIIGTHMSSDQKISAPMLVAGILVTSLLIVSLFPLIMFSLGGARAKGNRMYRLFLRSYIKIQKKNS
jgi:uncharacterized Tic20 family protein